MLLTNQRLDKLAAARVDFTARDMLNRTYHLFSITFTVRTSIIHLLSKFTIFVIRDER